MWVMLMKMMMIKMQCLSVKMMLILRTVCLMCKAKGQAGEATLDQACTSSAHLKAKAEKAALMEKAVTLQRRHELEAQEEKLRLESDKLRKIKEQLDIDAQIAAAASRLCSGRQ